MSLQRLCRWPLFVAAAAAALVACSSSGTPGHSAASAGAAPSSRPAASFGLPVSHPTVWLCRPGMANNPCSSGLSATVVQPDGKRSIAQFTPAKNPKIDCFYIYPTLSRAKTEAAPLAPDPAAVTTTKAQVGRFQSVCRLFVPVYRQFTLAALTGVLAGRPIPASVARQATLDVVSAWHDYLDHDNDGRGVVLLGHSQGASQLISLLKTEVDQSPAERALLVSAIALGGNLLVPKGQDVGATLQHIPACRAASQHDCVVAYSSFNTPPPAGSFFGRTTGYNTGTAVAKSGQSLQVLCVNPAALRGSTAPLHPYLPTASLGPGLLSASPRVAKPTSQTLSTGFVAYPGQLTGTCRQENGASWLQIDHPVQGTDGNNAPIAETLGPNWGLHLYDFNVDQGDLIALVSQQAASWH